MDLKKNYALRITGKVQGVFFRESAKKAADRLGLSGFVRNEPDGSVYAEAEGEEALLKEFAEWCRQGPESAEVQEVKIIRQPLRDLDGFTIAR